MQSFDFGNGPVPASRHENRDGTLGGWVAKTAYVDPSAIVFSNAQIFEYARVMGNSRILPGTIVSGNAIVAGSQNNLIVLINCKVKDNTKIYSSFRSVVLKNTDCLGDIHLDSCSSYAGAWCKNERVTLKGNFNATKINFNPSSDLFEYNRGESLENQNLY